MNICIDPGHGMSNKKPGVYDPGACAAGETEAGIVMDWGNELRELLRKKGHTVVRTRVDAKDPAPVSKRAGIAKEYKSEVMVSLHCNAANGQANGTETFYRGTDHADPARKLNDAVVVALSTRDRGIKTEAQSQHSSLAVMGFQPCFLIELGFIDQDGDRAKMVNPELRKKACEAIAKVLVG